MLCNLVYFHRRHQHHHRQGKLNELLKWRKKTDLVLSFGRGKRKNLSGAVGIREALVKGIKEMEVAVIK